MQLIPWLIGHQRSMGLLKALVNDTDATPLGHLTSGNQLWAAINLRYELMLNR
ncbi:hypothetical protein [Nostoc sp. KVJ20]|uniref:hypothetical protein n=1 Tax=Nostoc sp. KVJ20 TaxID=457944 RepID=UPI00159F1AEC|nr:hypothetical protein [Nostoc sp. KVJ20]